MKSVLAFLVTFTFAAAAAFAQGGPPWANEDGLKPKEGEEATHGLEWNADQQALLELYAASFDIEPSRLRDLREEGLGWGEIAIGLKMAAKSEAGLESIVEKRKARMKWEEIAAAHDLELGDVIGEQDALEVIEWENRPISELLSKHYDIPEEKLVLWRGDDLPWADLQIALEAAKRAGKSVDEILELYRSGWGWGDIAKSNGFSVAEIMSKAGNPLKKERGEEDP